MTGMTVINEYMTKSSIILFLLISLSISQSSSALVFESPTFQDVTIVANTFSSVPFAVKGVSLVLYAMGVLTLSVTIFHKALPQESK